MGNFTLTTLKKINYSIGIQYINLKKKDKYVQNYLLHVIFLYFFSQVAMPQKIKQTVLTT